MDGAESNERKEEKKEKKEAKKAKNEGRFPMKMMKKIKTKKTYEQLPSKGEGISKEEVVERLNEGKTSFLVQSNEENRHMKRRAGVAERNETERQLVRQTLENHIKVEYAKQYNFYGM